MKSIQDVINWANSLSVSHPYLVPSEAFQILEEAKQHAPEPAKPEASRVGDLCTLNARLIRALQKHEPDHPLIAKVIDYNTRHSLNGSPFRDEPEPSKPGDWMREAAADIIELTLDHPPKTSEELVKLLDTGAKVIAELCPAQPKRGDVQILIDALEHIAINEDRENLDGDPAEVALEQCNKMAEDALDEYRKSQPKREISARELIEELEKRHVKTFSNQVLTELEAERARADTGGAT